MIPKEEKDLKCKDCDRYEVPITKDAWHCWRCYYNPLRADIPKADRKNYNTGER